MAITQAKYGIKWKKNKKSDYFRYLEEQRPFQADLLAEGKGHWHHILPQHWFGEGEEEARDADSNYIYLSIPAHAEAHRLLHEQYGLKEDEIAYLALSGQTEEAFFKARSLGYELGIEKMSPEDRKEACQRGYAEGIEKMSPEERKEARQRGYAEGIEKMSPEKRKEANQRAGQKVRKANQHPMIKDCLLYGSLWLHVKTGVEAPIEPGQFDSLVGLANHLDHAILNKPHATTINDSKYLSLVIRGETFARYGWSITTVNLAD